MTLGGSWEEDDRTNIGNWQNDTSIGDFNINPVRIPKTIWDFISTRGTCVVPSTPPPNVTCTTDSDW